MIVVGIAGYVAGIKAMFTGIRTFAACNEFEDHFFMEVCIISVIIPFYKEIELIGRAVQSVANQMKSNLCTFEIIIGNDSTYTDAEILSAIPQSARSIVHIAKNTMNKGAGNARNAAIEIAGGDYYAFLDADDYWVDNKIDNQIDLLRCGASFVCGAYKFEHSDSIIVPSNKVLSTIDLLCNASIGTSTIIIKKDLLGSDRFKNLSSSQDTELWARLAGKNGFKYAISNRVCAVYSPSGRTSNKLMELKRFNSVVSIFKLRPHTHLKVLLRYIFRGIYNHYIRHYFK